ncbi:MAG: MBL fold metallo-hydrolase [Lachnospiraceae bacterium]|nr:MBL fold metallo-hydrolase [Lachnospiraceae bacterium]
MIIEKFVVGPIETNCYVVSDEASRECAVIDPGAEPERILRYLKDLALKCRYIFITHGHRDHTDGSVEICETTGAPICIHKKDVGDVVVSRHGNFQPPEGTVYYKEGDVFQVGSLEFQIIETPGHSPGGVTILCGDSMFCGDTLFRNSCGTVKAPGANFRTELKSLKKLACIEGDYKVYPGHHGETTLERERNYNMYMIEAMDTLF